MAAELPFFCWCVIAPAPPHRGYNTGRYQGLKKKGITVRSVKAPPQGNRAAASREEIQLSREFLEACLEERVSQDGPLVLDDNQREFLEVVATSATFRDVIAVRKALLEVFLAAAE